MQLVFLLSKHKSAHLQVHIPVIIVHGADDHFKMSSLTKDKLNTVDFHLHYHLLI